MKRLTSRAALLALTDADGPLVLPDTTNNDCAPVSLVVPMKVGPAGPNSTTKKIKVRATVQQTLVVGKPVKINKDADVLKLTCNP